MKITEYPVTDKFSAEDVFLVDGPTGTKTAKVANAILAALDVMSPENHRNVFRGKNLGTTVTTEQKAAIQAGTFKDLWLGDYWEINGTTWRIVDFDYWLNTGDPSLLNSHHLVIMPDRKLYDAAMNATNITTGGYVGSQMYKTNLTSAKATIASAFGSAVLTHREQLCNSVSNGKPSTVAWYDSTVELPNECMIYGHLHYSPVPDGVNFSQIGTIDKTQLALFRVAPKFLHNTQSCWLRDVVSGSYFAFKSWNGATSVTDASESMGVWPVFAIG